MTEGSLVHQTSDWVFQLVNVSLAFSQAGSFCRGQFSSLTTLGQPEDEEGTLELQRRAGLHGPMWVRDPNRPTSRPLALAKQCEFSNYSSYVLMPYCIYLFHSIKLSINDDRYLGVVL